MLGKLFKYEFKNTYKLMLTIYAVTLTISLLGSFIFSGKKVPEIATTPNNVWGVLGSLYILVYFLTCFALFVVTFVYMSTNFYKTMYSAQGYLTHTLPVKSSSTFHVKLAVSFIWILSSIFIMALSIFILLYGATDGMLLDSIFKMLSSPPDPTLGCSWGAFFGYILFCAALSCANVLLTVFAACSIGQLFHQNKIVFAVVAGIVLYFIQQIAGTILLLIIAGQMIFDENSFLYVTFADMMFSPLVVSSFALTVFFIAAFYIINIVILKKHLNLD